MKRGGLTRSFTPLSSRSFPMISLAVESESSIILTRLLGRLSQKREKFWRTSWAVFRVVAVGLRSSILLVWLLSLDIVWVTLSYWISPQSVRLFLVLDVGCVKSRCFFLFELPLLEGVLFQEHHPQPQSVLWVNFLLNGEHGVAENNDILFALEQRFLLWKN